MTEHRIKPGQGKKCKSGGASVAVGVVGALLMMSRNYRTASTSVNEAGSLGGYGLDWFSSRWVLRESVVPVDIRTLGVVGLQQKKLSWKVKSQFQVSPSLRVVALFYTNFVLSVNSFFLFLFSVLRIS